MNKYFLIENDHGGHLLFWRPEAHGYTNDMTKAGIYTGKERVECPIINAENLEERHNEGVKSFYIDVNDVELIGEPITINKVIVQKFLQVLVEVKSDE